MRRKELEKRKKRHFTLQIFSGIMDKKTAWYNIGKLSSLISEHSRHHEVMAQGQIMDVGLLIDIQKINLKIKEKDVDCFSGCVKTKYF